MNGREKNVPVSGKSSGRSRHGRYNPFYFIWLALQSMWRNRIMSIASVLILTSCLILLGCFGMIFQNLNSNLLRLRMLNEMVVFADYDLGGEDINRIYNQIKGLDNVKSVDFISKADALEDMKETYSDYPELFEMLEENGDNPLPDSFVVTYIDNDAASELEYELHSIEGVTKVNNRLDLANEAEGFKNGISFVFLWFFVLLLLVSVFVIFNTVKLAVHSRRAEIDIMRYIGGTKSFIVAPFVIEGVIIGLVSAVIGFFVTEALYRYAVGSAAVKLQMIVFTSVSEFRPYLIIGYITIGVLTGIAASVMSLRRNLNK
ncbi:MAG: permease-like cell division protein FtsX [Clostridiales bacterium]|nr:permease-like cell division protein FtsX [Clostridiales bacterium]